MSKIENFLETCASLTLTPAQGEFCIIGNVEEGMLHVSCMREHHRFVGENRDCCDDWETFDVKFGNAKLSCEQAIKFFREYEHSSQYGISENDIQEYFKI